MILTLKDIAKCKRCESSNTIAEMVIPSKKPDELRGRDGKEVVEITCKECGKINRREVDIKIE